MDKQLYKFNKNLLGLSKSDNIEIAKMEWEMIYEEKRENADSLCICQRKVKNIIYMFNTITNHTIIVGTTCRQKFNLKNSVLKNKLLLTVLKHFIQKGEYQSINNLIQYSHSVEEKLMEYIKNQQNIHLKTLNINKLNELMNDVLDLITTHHLYYLEQIYKELHFTIENLRFVQIYKKVFEELISCYKIFGNFHSVHPLKQRNLETHKNKYKIVMCEIKSIFKRFYFYFQKNNYIISFRTHEKKYEKVLDAINYKKQNLRIVKTEKKYTILHIIQSYFKLFHFYFKQQNDNNVISFKIHLKKHRKVLNNLISYFREKEQHLETHKNKYRKTIDIIYSLGSIFTNPSVFVKIIKKP